MVIDRFNMVDMGGIDLIESQGTAITGLFQRLVESIANCRYQCLYNWEFNGILIPPSYVEMTVDGNTVYINEGVTVDENDVISIRGTEAAIVGLSVTENGTYNAPAGISGYNPVNVNVPEYQPVLQSLTVTENGLYTPDTGYDGFGSVSVEVPVAIDEPALDWDFSQSLTDQVKGVASTLAGGASSVTDGILLSSASSRINFPSTVQNYPYTDFEIEFGEINAVLASSHMRLFVLDNSAGLIYRNNGKWSFYSASVWATDSDITDVNFFSNSILRVEIGYGGMWKIYKNGVLVYSPNVAQNRIGTLSIGAIDQSFFSAVIKSFKVY